MKRILLIICTILSFSGISGQTLHTLMDAVITAPMDNMKYDYSNDMIDFIKKKEYGSYDVRTPVKYMRYVKCTHADLELYSWSFLLENKSAVYYNVIKMCYPDTVVVLKGKTGKIEDGNPEFLAYDMEAFYGEDAELYLVMLGWNQTMRMNYKTIQMIHIDEEGRVSYDCPFMIKDETTFSRMRFQYKQGMSMTLKIDHKARCIMFDHMSAADDNPAVGEESPYGPDGTYCGFQFEKGGIWRFKEDVSIKDVMEE